MGGGGGGCGGGGGKQVRHQLHQSLIYILFLSYDGTHEKALMPLADNVGPDQRAYLCSLIWAFSARRHVLQYPLIMQAGNEGPDQPALMQRLTTQSQISLRCADQGLPCPQIT